MEWPEDHTGLAHAVAIETANKRTLSPGVEIDDLVQEGMVGVIKACWSGRHDPRRTKFSTYAGRAARNAMSRYINHNCGVRNVNPRTAQNRAGKTMRTSRSLDARMDPDGEWTLLHKIPDKSYAEERSKTEDLEHIRHLIGCLPVRDRAILVDYYFNGLEMKEIGAKYGFNKQRASKIVSTILRVLRAGMEAA